MSIMSCVNELSNPSNALQTPMPWTHLSDLADAYFTFMPASSFSKFKLFNAALMITHNLKLLELLTGLTPPFEMMRFGRLVEDAY